MRQRTRFDILQAGCGIPRSRRNAAMKLGSARSRLQVLLARFRRDQSGNYAILAALVMPALVGIGGLGTEAGLWLYKQQTAQGAADLGAISAATAAASTTALALEAQAVAASYGLVDGVNGVTVAVNQPPQSGTHIKTTGAVEVIVKQPQARLFSALFGSQSLIISARAVAVGNSGSGCLLALDQSGSGAVTVQGSAQVTLKNCNLYDNSSSSTALSVGGSGSISAHAVDVVGGISGSSAITTTNGIATGAAAMADPYASASFGSYSSLPCLTASGSTLSPGRYCGGISLTAGVNVTLNPGVYYLDQGSLSVAGNATLTGTGVTLVFTSSTGSNWANASISSNATINLTAPTSGATAGIVMFGDRNMTTGTPFKLAGGGTQIFGGAIYLPKGALTFTGGSSTGTACTQLIADTITFTGNSNLAASCSGYGISSLGGATATLVE